jgi:CBS domain-containing protein
MDLASPHAAGGTCLRGAPSWTRWAVEVAEMKVLDLMTTEVISVPTETPLKEVARLLAEHRVSGVPVVDENGGVVGIVSEADFVDRERGTVPARAGWLTRVLTGEDEARDLRARLEGTTAGAAMSAPATVIRPQASVREAATLMSTRKVNRLPVVEDGRLVGIVTRADLLDAYLQSDDELRREVREDVLRDTLWMDPDELDVNVLEGIVFVMGRVDRRSTAEILERLVRQLDGVIGVRCELTWDLDDRTLEPVGVLRREPTAASVTARDQPRNG